MTDFLKDTRLIVYVDEAGHLQSRLLTMPYKRVAEQFSRLHRGTQALPEPLRDLAIPLCGVFRNVKSKWEPDNG